MNKHPLKYKETNPYKYILLRQPANSPEKNPELVIICDDTSTRRFIGTKDEVEALRKKLSSEFRNQNYFISKVKV